MVRLAAARLQRGAEAGVDGRAGTLARSWDSPLRGSDPPHGLRSSLPRCESRIPNPGSSQSNPFAKIESPGSTPSGPG